MAWLGGVVSLCWALLLLAEGRWIAARRPLGDGEGSIALLEALAGERDSRR